MNENVHAFMCACMTDSVHDAGHVYRVLHTALQLAAFYPEVDGEILETACLLHDVGRERQYKDPSLCHAREGAKIAEEFLLKEGWNAERAAHVAACIRTHRFRSDDPPVSIEAKILFDADKLDVAGAVGIARTLMYNGQVERPLCRYDERGRALPAVGDRSNSFLDEYSYKLQHIYDRFYTKEGQAMALRRREAATHFYEALIQELQSGEGEM